MISCDCKFSIYFLNKDKCSTFIQALINIFIVFSLSSIFINCKVKIEVMYEAFVNLKSCIVFRYYFDIITISVIHCHLVHINRIINSNIISIIVLEYCSCLLINYQSRSLYHRHLYFPQRKPPIILTILCISL